MPSLGLYRDDGRLRGAYVYLLLCLDEASESIYLKVGMSADPIKRLNGIKTGCPVQPELMAVIHTRSKHKARILEGDLHGRFKHWHTHGEWFRLSLEDKPLFNQLLREGLEFRSDSGWKLAVVKFDLKELARQKDEARRRYWARFRSNIAFKAFALDSVKR